MFRVKTNKMMKRMLMIAMLTAGFLFVGVSQAAAQDCKSIKNPWQESQCWEKKAKSGGKDLSGAYLKWTNLSEVNLSGAYLSGANLSEANLSDADLSEADLSGADLRKKDLRGANFTKAKWGDMHVVGAKLNSATKGINLNQWTMLGAEVVP